jgi:hypothetical protein
MNENFGRALCGLIGVAMRLGVGRLRLLCPGLARIVGMFEPRLSIVEFRIFRAVWARALIISSSSRRFFAMLYA